MNRVMLVLVLFILLLFLGLVSNPQDKVVFLDVGQGDSFLLQDGVQQVLVDGSRGTIVLSRLAEEMPWFDRTIELVVVTHGDQDHIEGLIHVLDRYEVTMVLLPYVVSQSEFQEAFIERMIEKNVEYRFAWAGQVVRVGDMKFSVLGPLDVPDAHVATQKNINDGSVVMRVDYHDRSFLLTGDAEKPAEGLLVSHISPDMLDVDVMKVGHHGSKTSTTSEFFDVVFPSVAVISVGADNWFGHPHASVLEELSGISLFRTDENGSIRFLWFDGEWRLGVLEMKRMTHILI